MANLMRRWDPFREISTLRDRMERMFDDSLSGAFRGEGEPMAADWMPAVDVFENDAEIRVRAELPGLTEKDVEVCIEDGKLVLRGEKKLEKVEEKEDGHYRRVESRYGSFYRSLPLPGDITEKDIDARIKDGVLEVRLPKPEKAQPKHVKVKVA